MRCRYSVLVKGIGEQFYFCFLATLTGVKPPECNGQKGCFQKRT